ncbi:MAG: bifunctional glutamate N-acetyltransferase/amino-acid acetyltransferase ArgJ [Actinomycetia bacterium]|nr:bifunctional glutamate N-acetyltransferase/amino-acid acetyltransferase ArgJ [Actinomycetes bacterium]
MSVTAAIGFSAAGVAAGIKPDALDVAVIVADAPSPTAGVFTLNQAAAAPVVLDRESLGRSALKRGIVINSGCANAATGDQGIANGVAMAGTLADQIGCERGDVLVSSTGTIGPQLPMDLVLPGIRSAASRRSPTEESATLAARAILTTDSVVKQSVVRSNGWVVGGMSKGSGMVRPNMATMLAFLTTDALVEPTVLNDILRAAVEVSFNSLNIDGCESTNDSVIAMASGASHIVPDHDEFAAAMEEVCRDLALQMAADAEGTSRVVTINLTGGADDADSRALGRTVADSALVRSSFYGGDVNWGRILGALGTSAIDIDPGRITVEYEGVVVFERGMGAGFDEAALLETIETGDFSITIDMGSGDGRARVVTTDLTPEYVAFNGERS